MFRSLFIQASKKVGIFFSGAARRLEANDYLTKAIQIRELFWDYKGLVIILGQAGFSSEVLEGLYFVVLMHTSLIRVSIIITYFIISLRQKCKQTAKLII